MPTQTRSSAREAELVRAVELAVLAPSVHNTQPWLFRLLPDGLELRADRSRGLGVVDPLGRQVVLSCGGAWLLAREDLARRFPGVSSVLLPEPAAPDLLVRMAIPAGCVLSPDESFERVVRARHTNRRPFDDVPVPAHLLDIAVQAAASEGARLQMFPARSESADLVRHFTAWADRELSARPGYRAELARWLDAPGEGVEGVPLHALPAPAVGYPKALIPRDFDLSGRGALEPARSDGGNEVVLLLSTPGDTPVDWLRGGAALTRVLLALQENGLAARPYGQLAEIAETRGAVTRMLGLDGHIQMVVAAGYAPPTAPVGRRPVEDVLIR